MSFLSQKIQLGLKGTYQWWRVITFLAVGLMAGSLLMSAIFVYNYTFRTLEDAHTIVLLNTDMVVNNVNLENYQKAASLIEAKSAQLAVPNKVRNMFNYGSLTTSTAASSPSAYAGL